MKMHLLPRAESIERRSILPIEVGSVDMKGSRPVERLDQYVNTLVRQHSPYEQDLTTPLDLLDGRESDVVNTAIDHGRTAGELRKLGGCEIAHREKAVHKLIETQPVGVVPGTSTVVSAEHALS